mmetsp:Transcript_138/g.522  ORF Transcript_138/g.522 Transcript_138/m.522 type:complete len:229 (+) Transcript_138:265-951(+)|eukprot:CAMPEP_0168851442 /NCGR_PEP_ID=MMETSP0727-20121128/12415_1 /TAXON_ID=265536 /ORGANISM="Amphiprora sp., Strain CCMP467" /LENGTH=228 /DNA_ID=CAMNT_0008905437 /DNA_START=129 /DNA_END=815 /DNA_ORIENTATION=-
MSAVSVSLVNVALPAGQPVTLPFYGGSGNLSQAQVNPSYDASQLPPNTPPLADFYFHQLQVGDDLIISHVVSPQRISEFLQAFVHMPRRLILGSAPPAALPDSTGLQCLYQHLLPANQPCGLTITGFPPRLEQVSPTSPLFQKAYPGQFIHALVLPDGRPPLNAQSPGFTGQKCQATLDQETLHLDGRWLWLKDLNQVGVNAAVKTRHTPKARKEEAAFDMDGCCTVL